MSDSIADTERPSAPPAPPAARAIEAAIRRDHAIARFFTRLETILTPGAVRTREIKAGAARLRERYETLHVDLSIEGTAEEIAKTVLRGARGLSSEDQG